MEAIRQYFLSLVAAAVFCGAVNALAAKGTAQTVLKLLTGVFMTLAVLRPLGSLEIGELSEIIPSFTQHAEEAAAEGEIFAKETMADIIKTESEAYILDKAAGLNANLQVEVILDAKNSYIPVSVRLSGDVSPYARRSLQSIIRDDLGIPEENQLWIV